MFYKTFIENKSITTLNLLIMKKITLLFVFLISFHFVGGQILSENFDDVSTLSTAGWTILNVSEFPGATNWFQGDTSRFNAHGGALNSYIAADYLSASDIGQAVSTWLILPTLSLKNGDELSFYTRTVDPVQYPDRLQVRIGAGTNPIAPTNSTDVGEYTTLLLDINPTYLTTGAGSYPTTFTQYTVTVSGLSVTPVDARLAFRYFTEDNTNNSDYIGVDTVVVTSSTLGLTDVEAKAFSLFYNKDEGVLSLKSPHSKLQNVTLYNLLGQEVLSKKLYQTEEKVDVLDLNRGIYLAKVTLEGHSKTIKFYKD